MMGVLPFLNGIQKNNTNNNNTRKVERSPPSSEKFETVKFVSGLFFVVFVPYIHIGVIHKVFWVPDKPEVDREHCSCSCFDTIFKGPYESGDIGYKHIYFNATAQTLRIWGIGAFYFLLLYETVKYLIHIGARGQIRLSMLVLFFSNIYPVYYSWWSFFNYYNDDFYDQYNHQIFFTTTEMVSMAIVVQSCDLSKDLVPRKLLAVITISVLHLTLGGIDQFLAHILLGEGEQFQKTRDIGLSIPDGLHIIIPTVLLYRLYQKTNVGVVSKYDVILCLAFLSTGLCIGHAL